MRMLQITQMYSQTFYIPKMQHNYKYISMYSLYICIIYSICILQQRCAPSVNKLAENNSQLGSLLCT